MGKILDKKRKYLPGAKRQGASGSFVCQISVNGDRKYLGSFKTELEAHTAYMNYMDDNNIPYLNEIDKRRK